MSPFPLPAGETRDSHYGYVYKDKVSYRQVGRRREGQVIRRAPPQALPTTMNCTSSIPSKYNGSAKLARDAENDAFGNRTQRFHQPINELPGPGAYYRKTTLERDPATCGSLSRKGYGGGFASKAPRFQNIKEIRGALLPGPGTYTTDSIMGLSHEGRPQAVFAKPQRYRGDPESLHEIFPGPGQYYVELDSKIRKSNIGPTSSFRSFRAKQNCVPETPAPGAYDVMPVNTVRVDKRGQKLVDPSFRSQTKRNTAFTSPSAGVPGPGEYDIQKGHATANKDRASCTSSSKISRFGESFQCQKGTPESPGPGWYTPDLIKSELRASPSSMFVSTSRRFVSGIGGLPPGPAFYKPELQGKKSFHLNMSKTWV